MDSNITDKISHLLNEEKWSRAAIGSFSVSNFDELDSIIKDIADDETKEAVLADCEEHLAHNKNSIIGLYISGILTLSRNRLDDSNMLQLITLFTEAGKWNVAEALCNKMLALGDNKSALKILADCYKEQGQEENKIATWEKIIRVDHDETDITKTMAEKYEADGEKEKAINYYKKAILRYSQKKLFTNVKEIWDKLLVLSPRDLDFFHFFLKKISRTIQAEKIAMLMDDLYRHHKADKDWDNAIGMLKEIIALNFKGEEVRKEIIECYTSKYGDLPHFQNALNDSNLSQSWRPLNDAINDFEKLIAFVKGNFVYHNDRGIGRIKAVNDEAITIDFFNLETGRALFGQDIAIKMAVSCLSILPKDHIWVIKCTHKLSDLKKMVLSEIKGTLKTIIKSFDNCADLKLIKKELTQKIRKEGILNAKEWAYWSQEAKRVLMNDPEFGNILDKKGFFEVRIKPITQEEKLYNVFKNKGSFFDKYTAYSDYLKANVEKNEYYNDMLDYFYNVYRNTGNFGEKISSWLILENTETPAAESFAELYSQIPDVSEAFCAIQERQKDLREAFLCKIKETIPEWADIYCSLFPYHLEPFIPNALINAGCTEKIKDLFKKVLDQFKTYRKSFVWVCENEFNYSFIKEIMPSEEMILAQMLLLLDINNREISVSVSKWKKTDEIKLSKSIEHYLFAPKNNYYYGPGRIELYILNADQYSAKHMFDRLEIVTNINPTIVSDIKMKLHKKYPDINFETEQTLEVVYGDEVLTTQKGLEKKNKERDKKAKALEKQAPEVGVIIGQDGKLIKKPDHIFIKQALAVQYKEIEDLEIEISKAQLFNKKNLNLNKISFGTKVTLRNLDSNQNVVYTILGPFESEPEKNIISYKAPLADELLNAEEGEELHFEINGTKYNFKVLSIEASELV